MIETKENILIIDGKEIYRFDYPIQQVIDFDEVLVCRIEPPPGTIMNENVFGILRNGDKLWQIEKMKYVYPDSPFTNICVKNNKLLLNNWDGLNLIVDPKNGVIEKKEYSR